MSKLLFPVKPEWLLPVLLKISVLVGCGYEPAYGGADEAERLRVAAAQPKVARMDAVQAALDGARAELGRSGALAAGSGYPRMVVEVLRVDEKSGGIAATEPAGGGPLMPLARGSSVGVLGRAWVEEVRDGPPLRDTGDMRRVEHYASEQEPRLEVVRHDEAVRSAARQLGRALARRVLGQAEPDVELM